MAQSENTDCEGNRITRLAFAGATTALTVTSAFDLETSAVAPLAEEPDRLPWAAEHNDGLDACRAFSSGETIRAYAGEIAAAADHRAASPSSTGWQRTSARAPISASGRTAMRAAPRRR